MRYKILSLNGIMVQPGLALPIFVDKPEFPDFLFALEGQTVIMASYNGKTSKNGKKIDQMRTVGTLAKVINVTAATGGAIQVNIQTLEPVNITEVIQDDKGELSAEATTIPFNAEITEAAEKLKDKIGDQLKVLSRSRRYNGEYLRSIMFSPSMPLFIDAIISSFGFGADFAQKLLVMPNFEEKLNALKTRLDEEIGHFEMDSAIKSRVNSQMSKAQKEAYLNEKMRAIQKELGDDEASDANSYKQKINNAKLPAEVKDKALGELKKLRNLPPMSAETSVIKNWLDEILALPWDKKTESTIDLCAAEKIMDEDHDGLEKIKERILEHLAVIKQTGKSGGAILCFVGPPGTGKTSLGKSIARAMGRKYARISLGGVSDESHFRGHRKTYVGSQPGRIIDTLKRVKVKNPLIVLDEVDKMGRDYRGDPEAALLEILDPEQNKTFRDHYLEADFDLSDVMFIATANSRNMSRALLDRMEIIDLSGYVEDEKIKIAKNHLIKNAAETIGVAVDTTSIPEETLRHIIRYYTRESGVRELSRLIATVLRKSLRYGKNDFSVAQVSEWLGVQKYDFGKAEEKDSVGLINGLAWSEVGGDILQIEAIATPGKGKITITGHLGEVMKESAQIAKTCIEAFAPEFGVSSEVFEKTNFHIHALSGAVPKNGPSAGLALATVFLSAITGIPVRRDIAMTGEISLHGKALPIGGLREKLLGARRGGIKLVLIPEENRKDMEDIPEFIYQGMELMFVKDIREVIDTALTSKPLPIAQAVHIDGATLKG